MLHNQPSPISSPGFNTIPNRPAPSEFRDNLAREIMAALVLFAGMDMDMGDLPLDIRAELITPGEEAQAPTDPAKPADAESAPNDVAMRALARMIAKSIALEKFSFTTSVDKQHHTKHKEGHGKEKVASDLQEKNKEMIPEKQKPQAVERSQKPTEVQEPKSDISTDKLLAALLKSPQEKQAVKGKPEGVENTPLPPAEKTMNEQQNLKSNELVLHQWRQVKTSDIHMNKPLIARPLEKTSEQEKKSESDILPGNKIAPPKTPVIEKEMTENKIEPQNKEKPKETSDKHSGPVDSIPQKKIEKETVRMDMVIPLKKDDEIPPALRPINQFPTEQIPFQIEQPLNREGILKYSNQTKSTKLKAGEGYRLGDLFLMVFCAVLCGAKNTLEISRYLESKEKFFRVWLGLKGRLPPYRLLWFFINRLYPSRLQHFTQKILNKKGSETAVNVHIWESNRGLILGELNGDARWREDKLEEVLYPFDLRGSLITADAPKLLFSLARQIRREDGECLLMLSNEEESLLQSMTEIFESPAEDIQTYKHTLEDPHHIEIREIKALDELERFDFAATLPYRFSAVKFKSETITPQHQFFTTRYYLSTWQANPEKLSKAIRILSMLEAKVDWLLDGDFLFEGQIIENETQNLIALEALAGRLFAKDNAGSLASNQKKALTDNTYLRKLITDLYGFDEPLL